MGHTDGNATDASPGVEVGAEDMESPVSGRKPGEAEGCSQALPASVEHSLFDDPVRPPQQRRRDR